MLIASLVDHDQSVLTSHDAYGDKVPYNGRVSVFVVVLNSYNPHTIVVAAAAIRGHLSAASLETGPLIPETVSVSTEQVYDVSISYASGFDGTVTVTQETQLQMRLNITNNGNGIDTVTLSMKNEPTWAALGSDSNLTELQIGRGQTIGIVVTLSPNTAAMSGRDYDFQVVATSADGSETLSPDLEAQIEIKETGGEEVETEELEDEEEDSLPGFGVFASLLALTLIVLARRKA